MFTAPDFTEVQKDVAAIIKNKTLVGHSIATDLKVYIYIIPSLCFFVGGMSAHCLISFLLV